MISAVSLDEATLSHCADQLGDHLRAGPFRAARAGRRRGIAVAPRAAMREAVGGVLRHRDGEDAAQAGHLAEHVRETVPKPGPHRAVGGAHGVEAQARVAPHAGTFAEEGLRHSARLVQVEDHADAEFRRPRHQGAQVLRAGSPSRRQTREMPLRGPRASARPATTRHPRRWRPRDPGTRPAIRRHRPPSAGPRRARNTSRGSEGTTPRARGFRRAAVRAGSVDSMAPRR